jgi:hypothetical protein
MGGCEDVINLVFFLTNILDDSQFTVRPSA